MCRLEVNWFGRVGLLITCVGGRVVCRLRVNRNEYIETNLCVTLVNSKNHYMMHGQQNVKFLRCFL